MNKSNKYIVLPAGLVATFCANAVVSAAEFQAVGPLERAGVSIAGPTIFGQRLLADGKGLTANLNDVSAGSYVVVKGDQRSDGSVVVSSLKFIGAEYVPGASEVYLRGTVDQFASSTGIARVGGAQVLVSQALATTAGSINSGDLVEVVGIQALPNGPVWAQSVSIQGTGKKAVSIQGTGLKSTSIQGTGLTATSIQGTGLTATSIQGTGLKATSIQGTGLTATSIQGTGLTATSIQGTGLKATSIQGTGLTSTSIQGTGLTATSIQGAGLKATSIQGTGLTATSIQGTGLKSTSIQGTGLTATSIQGTGVQTTSIQGTGLEAISIQGTGLEEN